MNKVMFCCKCDELRETTTRETEVVHNIKGEEIFLTVAMPHCSECGTQLADLDIEEQHFDLALTEYRKKKNLLKPEEIRSIRELYGLSQRAFARALGFAEPTINRYENGAIQDNIHNNIILLAKDPNNMLTITSQSRHNLTKSEIESINSNVKQLQEKAGIIKESLLLESLNSRIKKIEQKVNKIDDIDKKVSHISKSISYLQDRDNLHYEEFFVDDYPKHRGYTRKLDLSSFKN